MTKVTLVGIVLMTAVSAMADTLTIDGIEWNYTVLDADSVRLDGIQTSLLSSNQLTTPTKIGGKTVTQIGVNCFYGRDTLSLITISEGVTTLEGRAFYECSRLKTIVLPSTLTSISGVLGKDYEGTIHPSSIQFPQCNTTFALSGGFLYSKTDKTLHCLLDGIDTAVVPDGVTSIPAYIGYSSDIRALILPESLKTIGKDAFYDSYIYERVVIPSQVTEIGSYAFYNACSDVEFMGGPVTLGSKAFYRCYPNVVFHAQAPLNISASGLADAGTVVYPKAYAAQYATVFDESQFAGYTDDSSCSVEVKSAAMRKSDPTVMDVTFRVTSSKPTVKVRALAFRDGVRDLAHAVRIKTYTDNFGMAIGNAITANEDHTFAWKVSSDFTNKIARLTVDVMAVEESPLTLEFVTIPASGTHPELTIARNRLSSSAEEDAVFWVWADKDSQLHFEVESDRYSHWYSLYDGDSQVNEEKIWSYSQIDSFVVPIALQKLGYDVATDEQLTYAREKTGYSFNNGPYAVKK